ncbi:Uncharacterized protein APZ42_004155, partial [Daphnia magna]
KKSQRIKRAQLRRDGLLPAWVEPPRPPPARERIPDEQLPAGAHAPSLQPFLEIARRLITVEQLEEATRPRYYGDIRYAPPGIPVGYPAPQPVPVPVPAPQPVPVPAPQPAPASEPGPASQDPAAIAADPTKPLVCRPVEEEDELQLCWISSCDSSEEDDTSTEEDQSGYNQSVGRAAYLRADQ